MEEKDMDYRTYLKNYPDKDGRFGPYGGAYLTDELSMNCAESGRSFREDRRRSITVNVSPRVLATARFI